MDDVFQFRNQLVERYSNFLLATECVLYTICAGLFQAGKPEWRSLPLHLCADQLHTLAKG